MTNNYLLFILVLVMGLFSSCNLLVDGDGNGNTIGAETLECTITNDITLTNHNENGVDYIIECTMELRGRMTVEEGTTIEFTEGAGISVSQDGSIKAEGIGGSPIIFRGQDAGTASWRGIYILTDKTTSVFDYVEIYDAGDGEAFGVFEDDNAAITLDGRMKFTNSKIDNSGGHGIYDKSEIYESEISSFLDNRITGCKDIPLFIATSYLDEITLSNTVFEENGENVVAITKEGCFMREKVTLETIDIPYFFTDEVDVTEGLVVEAGVQILMAEGASFEANFTDKAIVMAGTATNRISIGGKESQAGFWPGILLRNDGNNIFENVDISDGGSTSAGANDGRANITLEFNSQLTLIDCTSSRSNSDCDVILHESGGVPTINNMSTGIKVCEE